MSEDKIKWGPWHADDTDRPDGRLRVSRPFAMRSAAGWYVGQVCEDDEGFVEPYDRLSHYVATEAEAEAML